MQVKRLLLKTLTGVVALTLVTPVFAIAMCNMSAPFGWYVEGNAGKVRISNNGNSSTSKTINGVAVNVNIGYKFFPYFGMEIGGTAYPNGHATDPLGNNITIKSYSYDIAGRAIVPIVNSSVEAFGKLGAIRVNTSATGAVTGSAKRNTTGLYVGLGAAYYFVPEFAVNVQWQRGVGNNKSVNTVDLYSAGVSYIFDL